MYLCSSDVFLLHIVSADVCFLINCSLIVKLAVIYLQIKLQMQCTCYEDISQF